MNAIVDGKVFKSGNSAAVRLPKEVAFDLGTAVTIERKGDAVIIRPKEDPEAVRRELRALFDDIDAIWKKYGGPPKTLMPRDPDIFPDRPGLYR